MNYLQTGVGFFLLFLGGECLIRGSVALAHRMGLSALLIGLTIVSAGTSAPELLVSVQAAFQNQPDITLGNIIGSNIANILLILGFGALIHPIRCTRMIVFRDGVFMLLVSFILVFLARSGEIHFWHGAGFVVGLALFLSYSYFTEKNAQAPSGELHKKETEFIKSQAPSSQGVNLLLILFGLAGLIGGANLFVLGSVSLAESWGVPTSIIGLSLVAVGTSLPELVTSIIAAFKGETDVIVGNVLGSNIFNILGIIGISSLICPLPIDPGMISFDIWIMLGSAVVLLPLLLTEWRLSRKEGMAFLCSYALYIAVLYYYRVP